MPATYAWTIDRVNTKELGEDMAEEVGTFGPRDASDAMLDELKRGKGHVFRILDDDGIWYYRGRIVFLHDGGPATCRAIEGYRAPYCVTGGLDANPDGEDDEFGPLRDFGTPNAGATEIHYRCADPDGAVDGGQPVKVWAIL